MQPPAAKAGRPPITASPAFPWIVALWFAALFGIGSLIVPIALMERVVLASGLSSVLPMAAPPLGFTAQALVALVGTVVGAMLGLTMARRMTQPQQKKIGTSEPTASTKERKPLNLAEDFDDADLDEHDRLPTPKGRRRALAIEVEEGPSDFLNVAPLPGSSEKRPRLDASDAEFALMEELEEQGPAEAEATRQEFLPEVEDAEFVEEQPLELDPSTEIVDEDVSRQEFHTDASSEKQEFIADGHAPEPVIDVAYGEPVVARATAHEPLPFSPPSMARQGEGPDDSEADPSSDFAPDFSGLPADQPIFSPDADTGEESEDRVSDQQFFEASHGPAAPSHDFQPDDAPSHEDGLVQLVQRLGSTLEKHREWSAEQAAHKIEPTQPADEMAEETELAEPAADVPVPDEFDVAAAEEAAQAMAAYFGNSSAVSSAADTQPVEDHQPAAFADDAQAPAAPVQTPAAPVQADTAAPGQRYGALTGIAAAAMSGYDDDDSDDDEIDHLAASFTLPRPMSRSQSPHRAPLSTSRRRHPRLDEAPGEIAETVDTATSDAVTNINPFKRNTDEFVRIDEPEPEEGGAQPAVLFPNQDSRKNAAPASRAFDPPVTDGNQTTPQRTERPKPSNDDNERALREALMNLQRMAK